MKNIIKIFSIILLTTIVSQVQAQKDDAISPFKDKKPREKGVIFLADMPPCVVGIAMDHHETIGLSEETLSISKEIIADAMKEVPKFKKQLRSLEIELMNASQEERYNDYEKILDKIGELKKKASLFHEELVKRARKEFPKEDIHKIDLFIQKYQNVFLEDIGL